MFSFVSVVVYSAVLATTKKTTPHVNTKSRPQHANLSPHPSDRIYTARAIQGSFGKALSAVKRVN